MLWSTVECQAEAAEAAEASGLKHLSLGGHPKGHTIPGSFPGPSGPNGYQLGSCDLRLSSVVLKHKFPIAVGGTAREPQRCSMAGDLHEVGSLYDMIVRHLETCWHATDFHIFHCFKMFTLW